ncbi:hypothetical protein GW17_00058645 [Ensete ventricosum]|nr:hypothetical protein GW17_00058645 [Ensete ventricosum]
MTLDLLYRLHPDLEYRDIRSPYCSTCLLQRLAAKVGATYEGGATTCLLYACRGGLPRPGPLQGAAARRAATRKGRPPEGTTGCDQLARANRQQSARKGLPPAANPAASKGRDADRKGGRPLGGQLPTAKGSCRCRPLRRRRNEGEGGLGHLFEKKMIMPFRI